MAASEEASLGPRFWTLWSAFTATNLADGLSLVALPLLALAATDDARLVAMVVMFQYLPFLVIGLPAGVVIDRFDRRRIAVAAQMARAAVVGGLGLALLQGTPAPAVLFVVSFLIGVSEVLTDGGLPALVRALVRLDQLEVANARLSATQTVSNAFVGPPLGALLFELDMSLPFIASAAVTMLGVVGLLRLPGTYEPAVEEAESLDIRSVLVGVRYVWSHDVLRPLVVAVGLFSFVGAAGNGVFVVLASERFGLDGVGFGLLISFDAIAAVLTSTVVAGFISRTSHSWSMRTAVICFVIASMLYGLSTNPVLAFAGALFAGVSGPGWNIVSATVRQRLVPDAVFGRMMTAYLFIAWGARPLGALIGGFVAERWGPQWVWIGAGLVVGSLLITARSMFARIDAAMDPGRPAD
ncbi:MAG: MFS transporter [Acidimicrobiales bacterium]